MVSPAESSTALGEVIEAAVERALATRGRIRVLRGGPTIGAEGGIAALLSDGDQGSSRRGDAT
jgi:hypothetical protein